MGYVSLIGKNFPPFFETESVTKETLPPTLAYAFSLSDWWDTCLKLWGGGKIIFFLYFVSSICFFISSSFSCFLSKAPRSSDSNKKGNLMCICNQL